MKTEFREAESGDAKKYNVQFRFDRTKEDEFAGLMKERGLDFAYMPSDGAVLGVEFLATEEQGKEVFDAIKGVDFTMKESAADIILGDADQKE